MAKHYNRLCENWLDSYVELQARTEPAKMFDIWTGLSVIASALRRKVTLQLGRLVYHTNIYVVLVAEPGVARKTQAIKYGVKFIDTIPDIKVGVDSTSKEAMTDDIESSTFPDVLPTGEQFLHSSLSIISKEFESFLGAKKENNRMLTALTDLFDCPDKWTSRTRNSKSNDIIKPWLNLLAATTPDSLANSLPTSAVGGGLTSRIMFIWADKKKCSVAVPDMNEKEMQLKASLEKDFYQISRICGEYSMTKECLNNWIDWYNAFDEDESGERICQDRSFSGWYSRKPTYIMKIAMLCAACESNDLILQWKHVERAVVLIRDVELTMGNAFRSMGKSELSADVGIVFQLVKSYGSITEKALMNLVWKDLDSSKFEVVMDTLIKSGRVKREYKDKAIMYKCLE